MSCHHTDVSVLLPSSQAPVVHQDSQERGVYQARPALRVLQRLPVPTSQSRTTVRPWNDSQTPWHKVHNGQLKVLFWLL